MTTDILFHSNEEALFTGINLVKQIFTRFARLQTNTPPEPEDELLNGRLDAWFEALEDCCKADIQITIVDFVHKDGMTQNELYMILILLGVQFETGLKEACAAMRGHSLLQALSPSLLLDLLFPTGMQKIQLYKNCNTPCQKIT